MKVNIYAIVFGAIAILIILAWLSTSFIAPTSPSKNISLSSLPDYGPAPNLQGISGWINSPPLNISKLRGKVVLIDFWTYSCINCIRTIPHLNAWESAYGNNGLVIIGVSTPEFQFEHNYSNVLNAVDMFGIKYAVALDNNYSTWEAYNNHYWPADYIIDKNGTIRAEQFGEGNYNQTEAIIRELLVQAGYTIPANPTNVSSSVNFSGIGSPEMYLGYNEMINHGSPLSSEDQALVTQDHIVDYPLSNITMPNTIYLAGEWNDNPEYIVSVNNSRLFLVYKARDVNIVASGDGVNSSIVVKLDGKALNQSYLGSDAHISGGEAIVNISSSRLYNIVSAPNYSVHVLEIDANPNVEIYTFTFG